MRSLFALAVSLPLLLAAETPQIQVSPIATPAGDGSLAPALAVAPDDSVWLSWVERSGTVAPRSLRIAHLLPHTMSWTDLRTVASAGSVPDNPVQPPQIVVQGPAALTALWIDPSGSVQTSATRDNGATWTPAVALPQSSPSTRTEALGATRLAGGSIIALAQGRSRIATENEPSVLLAREVGAAAALDSTVDPSVCSRCAPAVIPFLDGGALAAYRGRSPDGARDIRVARFRHGRWEAPRPLVSDDWRTETCPVNGPRLATDGSRVAAAWFTAADDDPRVLVSYSPDAGTRWLMPLRVEHGKPIGHPDVALLKDAAILVTWIEADGSLWLRRVTPDFDANPPIELAPAGAASIDGFPRLAVLEDYAGAQTRARVLIAFTAGGRVPRIRCVLASVPEGALVMAESHCACAPTSEELQGFAIRGRILTVDPRANSVRSAHAEVPGVFDAGTHAFFVSPETLVALTPGRDFLGRIEHRDGGWWLFAVRLLETSQ